MTPVWVFVGGGTGSVLRWALTLVAPQPWATLAVNLLGSFLLAWLAHPGAGVDGPAKAALAVGLMGGFTTYSTFNQQLLDALRDGRTADAAIQLVATVGGALVAGAAGWAAAGAVTGSR
jgi:CrcB protein